MRKRIWAAILSLCVALTMMPTVAFAADAENVFEVASAEELANAVSAINAADDGSYTIQLMDDITLPATYSGDMTYAFKKNITTIIGNDHTMKLGAYTDLRALSGATLNLSSEENKTSLIVDGNTNHNDALIYVGKNSTLNMYDGVTLQNSTNYGGAGGVQVNTDGTFHMFGGTIQDCHADSTYGGGVLVDAGSFIMEGGTITNCSAAYGGGIFVSSAKTGWFPRKFIITGGEISNNTATYGGGIALNNTNTAATVTNCTITNNSADIAGGILLMGNSYADFSDDNNKIYNNTATAGAADIFLNKAEDSITLFDAATMDKEYRTSGQKIDGWYNDDPPYTPSDAQAVDVSKKLTGELALVASYRVIPQVTLTYNDTNGTTLDTYTCPPDTEVEIASAPTRDGYVFTGWKDAAGKTYYAGEKITPDGDMTLTAQWQEVNDWNQQPTDDNDGRLDVSVDVDVDVAVDVGVDADAKVDGTDKLSDGVRTALTTVMNGKTPNGMTDEQVAALRTLLNRGASKIEAKLTVSAKLETTPTEEELKALLGEAFTSGEEAQKWDLSVTMTTTALSGSDVIDRVENVPITETTPITFSLTTGQNLSGKDVRVLHVLDNSGSTEAVDSSVANAADGTVTFAASKFSPYVILSKTRSSGGHHSSGSTTTYTIKASAGTGGSISPDGSVSVSKGASKTFTITAKDGYEISDVLVDGKSVGAKSSYTFENISASHTIAAQFRKTATVDVTDPAVTGVAGSLQTDAHNVYLRGYPNGSFGPNSQMTRAEAAQMFYNLLIQQDVSASASFSDVADSAWYATAVKTLASMNIIKGVGGDRFAPERSITRAEFAAIATRFAKTDNSGSVAFRDVESSDWFYSSVLTAVNYGWINGYSDNTFRPENTITRAEVAAIVNRMLARAGDTAYAGSHTDEIKQFTDVSDTFWGYSDIIEATNAHDYSKISGTESWK